MKKTRNTEALTGREGGNHGRAKHTWAWTINSTTGFAWLFALVSISSCASQPCSLPTLLSTLRPEQPVPQSALITTPQTPCQLHFCSLSAALRLSGRGRLLSQLNLRALRQNARHLFDSCVLCRQSYLILKASHCAPDLPEIFWARSNVVVHHGGLDIETAP
jgi:hypothetical protein